MSPVNRRLIFIGAAGLIVGFVFVLALVYVVVQFEPEQREDDMARAKALVDTENYLNALEALRTIPARAKNAGETHAYLGAAYLQLHLYKAAIDEFEQAARQSPREADPRLGLAAAYIRLGDGPKALEEARKAAEIGRDSIDSWLVLGRAQWLSRNFDDAEKAGLKVLDLSAGNLQAVELLLHVYFDQNDAAKFRALLDRTPNPDKPVTDLASQFFLRQAEFRRANEFRLRPQRRGLERQVLESQLALNREPGRMELYPQLVRNLVQLGRFEEAIAVASKYRGPASLDLELGKAYASLGKKDEALRAYQRASAARTHKLSAEIAMAALTGDLKHWQEAFRAERVEQDHFVLAQLEDVLKSAKPAEKAFIYRYAGTYDAFFYNNAAEQARAVLDERPADFDALMTISTAYQRLNRNDDALRYAEIARDAYPTRAEPWSRIGGLGIVQKDAEGALRAMERAVQLEPSNPTYLYNAGWLHEQLGRTAQAASLYQRAITASTLSFEAMNNLALMNESSGRSDQALELLKRAVVANPEHEAAYFNLADYFANRGLWREALTNYRTILSMNPASSIAAVNAGRILVEQGRVDEGIDQLNRALDIDAHALDAYIVLSSAYEKTGHEKEALAALDEARRIRPDDPAIQTAKDRITAAKH